MPCRAVARSIFEYIHDASDEQSQWLVRVSYLQIYNEKITDLLNASGGGGGELRIREKGANEVYVEDLSEHVVRNVKDADTLLQRGKQQRTTNSTGMNKQSSRSHAVFTVIVEHSETNPEAPEERVVTVGKLHLVDLAGSERFDSSRDDKLQKETQNINTSLST